MMFFQKCSKDSSQCQGRFLSKSKPCIARHWIWQNIGVGTDSNHRPNAASGTRRSEDVPGGIPKARHMMSIIMPLDHRPVSAVLQIVRKRLRSRKKEKPKTVELKKKHIDISRPEGRAKRRQRNCGKTGTFPYVEGSAT